MVFEYPTNYSEGLKAVNGVGDFFFDYIPYIIPQFTIGVVAMVWLITFSLNIYLGSKNAITVSSFITLIIATIFAWAGILTIVVPLILLILVIVGIIFTGSGGTQL